MYCCTNTAATFQDQNCSRKILNNCNVAYVGERTSYNLSIVNNSNYVPLDVMITVNYIIFYCENI